MSMRTTQELLRETKAAAPALALALVAMVLVLAGPAVLAPVASSEVPADSVLALALVASSEAPADSALVPVALLALMDPVVAGSVVTAALVAPLALMDLVARWVWAPMALLLCLTARTA